MKSNYTGLWLLLTTSILLVTVYAFSEDIHIFSYTPKKASIAETLLPSPAMPPLDSLEMKADSIEIALAERKPVETDSLPKSILLFGDSMTFNLAIRLAKYARHNGHTMHAVNWDSSNTKIWAESDTIRSFIRKYNADFIFISLGSNEVYFKNPRIRLPYIQSILSQIGDIPYVWIGPPNWNEDTGINDILEASCVPGAFFRSQGMEFKRKADKIHPTRESSALWMDSIMRWMTKSSHPILAECPPDSLRKVNTNVIFLKALNK